MEFSEVIRDTAKFPDTMTVKIGDAEIPLGSIRALSARERQELEQGIGKNKERETELETRKSEVLKLAAEAQRIMSEAEAARTAAAGNTQSVWDDAVYAPLRKEFDKEVSARNDLSKKYEQLFAAVGALAQVGIADREERQFEAVSSELRKREKFKDWDLNKLKNFAAEKNKKDKFGLLDLRAAAHDLTEEDRGAEESRRAREEGIQEGKRIALASRIQQPSTNQGFVPRVINAKDGEATLDNLEAEMMNDPEIRKLWEQTLSGGAV